MTISITIASGWLSYVFKWVVLIAGFLRNYTFVTGIDNSWGEELQWLVDRSNSKWRSCPKNYCQDWCQRHKKHKQQN